MKTGFFEELRCLGALRTFCDACAREIPQAEDRNRCLDCKADLCLNCPVCSNHAVARCPGFGEVADLPEVLAKAEQYVSAASGRFQGRDDIYITAVRALVGFLIARLRDAAEASKILEQVPPGFRQRVDRDGEAWLRRWVSLRNMGRFVDYFSRRAISGRLPYETTWFQSQGSYGPIMWRGRPVMKTVWDFALSSIMFEEIRPKTVIELGTASGGSAIWYADIQRMLGLTPCVKTLDIDPPLLDYEGVSVLHSDSNDIARFLPHAAMETWAHPWLVIEDAHENIGGVLEHFHGMLINGDYLSIEDIDAEQALGHFLLRHPGIYMVDARYTDYFGHNATCSADQILCRMNP
jgi:cephalosporin hydroxylase